MSVSDLDSTISAIQPHCSVSTEGVVTLASAIPERLNSTTKSSAVPIVDPRLGSATGAMLAPEVDFVPAPLVD